MHTSINGGIDYVPAAHNVGLDRFKRVVLACRHLLERGRVHYNRNAGKGAPQPVSVPNIADKVPQPGIIEARRLHLMLFQLVAAENDQLARAVVAEHNFHKLLSE